MTVDFFGITKFCTLFLVLWLCEFKTLVKLLLRYSGPISLKILKTWLNLSCFALFWIFKKLSCLKSSSLIFWFKINRITLFCATCSFLLVVLLIPQYQEEMEYSNRQRTRAEHKIVFIFWSRNLACLYKNFSLEWTFLMILSAISSPSKCWSIVSPRYFTWGVTLIICPSHLMV